MFTDLSMPFQRILICFVHPSAVISLHMTDLCNSKVVITYNQHCLTISLYYYTVYDGTPELRTPPVYNLLQNQYFATLIHVYISGCS